MFWIALLLGIVEGLTEFLPISSTGHLILVSELIGFRGHRAELFQIFIQLGAILSVVAEYRHRLARIVEELPRTRRAQRFGLAIAIAFTPFATLGLLFHDWLIATLFSPRSVAAALIVGGGLILFVEGLRQPGTTTALEEVSPRQALGIGAAQCLALWPGFSRSAATILGGLVCKLDRRTATEFSFFLAIPTMIAAGGYSMAKLVRYVSATDLLWLAMAFGISFFVAWASIRWLLRFVSNHTFRPFAIYRIVLGALILLLLNGR